MRCAYSVGGRLFGYAKRSAYGEMTVTKGQKHTWRLRINKRSPRRPNISAHGMIFGISQRADLLDDYFYNGGAGYAYSVVCQALNTRAF